MSTEKRRSRPRVLLLLRDYRRAIHEAIAAFALKAGWQLEFAGTRVLPGWAGDGIIADDFRREDLDRIHDLARTPMVVRNHITGPCIRRVHGDAKAISALAFAYFRERGYASFATADVSPWEDDPAEEFAVLARSRGFPAPCLRWGEQVDPEDFAAAVGALRPFLRDLPRPSAVLIPGLWAISHFYRACQLEGIRIPQDLAMLVNNDDPVICEAFSPAVSSIAGEISRLGWVMAETLDNLMTGRSRGGRPVRIAPDRIITRQSTDMLAVAHEPTARAVHYLLGHFAEDVTVPALAAVAGTSVMTLERQFLRHLNRLPHQLLREVRLGKAAELLAETALPLREIAQRVGYGSAMSFSAAFKQAHAETAGTYRAREQAKRGAGS